jgi:hypothetical protein
MEQSSSLLAVEMDLGKYNNFNIYLAKRTRPQFGACAEVHFPDYGTELWSPDSRIYSKKALRFQPLSYEDSESLFWRMRRNAVS